MTKSVPVWKKNYISQAAGRDVYMYNRKAVCGAQKGATKETCRACSFESRILLSIYLSPGPPTGIRLSPHPHNLYQLQGHSSFPTASVVPLSRNVEYSRSSSGIFETFHEETDGNFSLTRIFCIRSSMSGNWTSRSKNSYLWVSFSLELDIYR